MNGILTLFHLIVIVGIFYLVLRHLNKRRRI